MNRLLLSTVVAAVLLPGAAALANPISSDALRLRQPPGTRHVQITFAVDTSVETLQTPLEVKRDGFPLKRTWTGMPGGFTANTGSGLVSLDGTQICDCHMDPGTHTYLLKLKRIFKGQEQIYTREAKITVETSYNPPLDAGTPAADMMPWEIPEPTRIQGLDCSKICPAVPGGDSGGEVSDRGGCSWAGAQRLGGGLGLMLGLAVLGLALRRRRR